ncbi:class I SAM-dependent methyltransferase [Bradyrhizobium sp.]|uniref:class I SAM-dependent methyltransferase n=1 Tax=Bradyrhizobium sp. TaxID=376 RepID=UPI0025C4298D|nr:class I SAM-dependent methyltransferase [Bradyrhizobium sp.]
MTRGATRGMGGAQPAEELTESYVRWRSSRLGRITDALERQLLARLLGKVDGQKLLDVGCGDGAIAFGLAQQGATVTALDADPSMIAAARVREKNEATRVQFVEGDAESLPFGDATFDVVVAVTVLCFVQDAERAVKEIARVLKPGGRLVIGELGRWSLWAAQRRIRGWLGHPVWRAVKFRTAADLRSLAEAAGLRVVAIHGAVYYPPFGIAARLLAPVDLWLGQETTFGAAFLAMSAAKVERVGGGYGEARQ